MMLIASSFLVQVVVEDLLAQGEVVRGLPRDLLVVAAAVAGSPSTWGRCWAGWAVAAAVVGAAAGTAG
jgi:hypothetical protein